MGRSQVPELLREAAQRRPRRRRSRALLIPLEGTPLSPHSPLYNNYLAPPPLAKPQAKPRPKVPGSPSEAPRRAGAPLGNRNAAKHPHPDVLDYEARCAAHIARCKAVIARVEAEIAALALLASLPAQGGQGALSGKLGTGFPHPSATIKESCHCPRNRLFEPHARTAPDVTRHPPDHWHL